MLRHDYSQLAVMSGSRQLVGAVSWESMAKAAMVRPDLGLADATVPARLVRLGDPLIPVIGTIIETGFLFVDGDDRALAGIVTTADLSDQFATLANPFFLLGEIERRLRHVLSACFVPEDFARVRDPADGTRPVESADDMTIGEILRLLERPEHYDRLEWPVDRREFVQALDEVREIRNEVMHFSPDPLAPEQLGLLHNFTSWLATLDPRA